MGGYCLLLYPASLPAFEDHYGKSSHPSPACRQENHTKGDRQGLQTLPYSQAWFASGSPSRGAQEERGSLPSEQCPHSVPIGCPMSHQQPGTEYLPCWPHSSSTEEAAEKMQLQQTTATRASAAIHTWH